MEGRRFRHGFVNLCRQSFIYSPREWRLSVGRGDARRLSRKGAFRATESTEEKTSGADERRRICVSSYREREALYSRSRNAVGLRHQGESLGADAASSPRAIGNRTHLS